MSKFRFREKVKKFEVKKRAIIEKMAVNALNYFKVETFDKRSFDGKPWAPLKNDAGRQPLVKTGRMRNGFKYNKYFGTYITRVDIVNNVPYFQYHNEGTKTIPKRQMMGDSKQLLRRNAALLKQLNVL